MATIYLRSMFEKDRIEACIVSEVRARKIGGSIKSGLDKAGPKLRDIDESGYILEPGVVEISIFDEC